MQRINVSEFKAVCLALLERVRREGKPVEILKNGKPLAVVYPPPRNGKRTYGALKDTLTGPMGDITSPLDDLEWEVLK